MMQRLISADEKMKQAIRTVCHSDLPLDQEEAAFQRIFKDYGATVRGLAIEAMQPPIEEFMLPDGTQEERRHAFNWLNRASVSSPEK